MLSLEDRIKLRDEIHNILRNLSILITHKNGTNSIHRRSNFIKALNNNLDLKNKYNLYIQQFRSEEEAIYCIIHLDDFENHKCIICGELCRFYEHNCNNKYKLTCERKECIQKMIHSESAIKKMKDTNKEKYGNECVFGATEIKNKIKETNLINLGVSNPAQNPDVIKKRLETYKKNHLSNDPVTDKNILEIFDSMKNEYSLEKINKDDIYFNIRYFRKFIKLLFLKKNRKLKIYEIGEIFERQNYTIQQKIKKFHLVKYIDIKDSDLELKFKIFLIENNFKENIDFERHNRSILSKTDNNRCLELDFYLKDYNIAFEINDLATHNITKKNQYYHYTKTLQCFRKGIKLIHLWEWELTDEELWCRISNWILNLLNKSKIQLDIKDCIIKEVSIEKQQEFMNLYNLNGYKESDRCTGIYYNDDLVQVLSFNNNELAITTKFGYDIIDIAKVIQDNILLTRDLSKMMNIPYNFKLLKYKAPQKISYSSSSNKCKQMYDCGKNIYIFKNA